MKVPKEVLEAARRAAAESLFDDSEKGRTAGEVQEIALTAALEQLREELEGDGVVVALAWSRYEREDHEGDWGERRERLLDAARRDLLVLEPVLNHILGERE